MVSSEPKTVPCLCLDTLNEVQAPQGQLILVLFSNVLIIGDVQNWGAQYTKNISTGTPKAGASFRNSHSYLSRILLRCTPWKVGSRQLEGKTDTRLVRTCESELSLKVSTSTTCQAARIAVTGPHGSGKATLLQSLGKVLLTWLKAQPAAVSPVCPVSRSCPKDR